MSVKAIAVNPANPGTFIEIAPPMPQPGEHDLLVEVKAVSVNPVDTKVHAGIVKNGLNEPRILGWDASGIVTAVERPLRDLNPVTKCGTQGISLVRAAIPPIS
jgi:NADPH:quinone reductase-like Zn-dependent oxidoreductase